MKRRVGYYDVCSHTILFQFRFPFLGELLHHMIHSERPNIKYSDFGPKLNHGSCYELLAFFNELTNPINCVLLLRGAVDVRFLRVGNFELVSMHHGVIPEIKLLFRGRGGSFKRKVFNYLPLKTL